MGVYIPNMEKPKDCEVCPFFVLDGAITDDNEWVSYSVCDLLSKTIGDADMMNDCPLIEVRDDYFKYYLECERLNDSRDLLKHRGCMDCDVKLKCLYAFTPKAEECNHYSNADQHTQSIESVLNRETCNLAYYGICTDGDCNKCPFEEIEIDEPKVGTWVELNRSEDGTHNIQCTYCRWCAKSKGHANSFYTAKHFSYCPHCGAEMRTEF